MSKLAYSFAIILTGLSLGYVVQILVGRGIVRLPIPIDYLRKLLQRTALLFVNPVAIVGALWIVNIESIRLAALPFNGLFAILAGGVLALGLRSCFNWSPGRRVRCIVAALSQTLAPSALWSASFFLGTGICLRSDLQIIRGIVVLRDRFPYRQVLQPHRTHGKGGRIKRLENDPFILVALSSIALGGLLNRAEIQRPEFFRTVVSMSVPLGTVMLLTSIGLALEFRKVRNYLKECISVSIIKFVLGPGFSRFPRIPHRIWTASTTAYPSKSSSSSRPCRSHSLP